MSLISPSQREDPLYALLARLPRARILVVGDMVLDQFITGRTERISREAPVPIVRETHRTQCPGGGANVVAGLCALGAKTRVLGVVGDDSAGESLRALLSAAGANVASLLRVKGRPTEAKTRILAGGLSLTPQQVVRLDQGSELPLEEAISRKLVAALERALPRVDVVAVSDYGLGSCTPKLRRALRRAARTIPVVVDSRFDLRSYAGVSVIKPNGPELEAASGQRLGGAKRAATIARGLARELELSALLLTRGHEGLCLAPAKGRALQLAPHGPPEAVDVTGAGDTVLACFCAALATGASFAEAARLANIAGGLVVQKPGTATVSPEELEVELRPRHAHPAKVPPTRAKRGPRS